MFRKKRVLCAVALLVCVCCLGCVSGCFRNSGNAEDAAEPAGPADGALPAPLAEEPLPPPETAPENGQQSETGQGLENGQPPEGGPETAPEGAVEEALAGNAGEAPGAEGSGAPETQAAELNDIPEALRMPRWGESPRFPQDRLIGPLGRGDADAGAYRYVGNLMETLLLPEKREDALSGLGSVAAENLARILDEVQPAGFRIGGGQDEGDNSFSFLIRFLGSEKTSAGEVYVYLVNERWTLEDMILEEEPEGEVSRFDYPSYQRFF